MIAYFDCIGGLSGDMLLSALLDAGAPKEALSASLKPLGLENVDLRLERVKRHGISALRLDVVPPEQRARRTWLEIRTLLEEAELEEHVRSSALEAFARLAEVEATIHATPMESVHFHELGAVDTLIDLVGSAALLSALGIDRVVCSPLPFGRGTVHTEHGVLPLPAPATVALLRGAPVFGVDVEGELVTPTGAVLAATLADDWGLLPPMTLSAIGYGAGTNNWPQRANVVRVLIGRASDAANREVVVLEANLDDLLPELVPDAVAACFAAGALDVWTTPASMKKGRPGIVMAAVALPGDEEAVARALLSETTTLGVRTARYGRWELERELRVVHVRGHTVRVKFGRLDGEVVNIAPEHDDCVAVARAVGATVKSVWAAALAAAVEL